MFVEKFVEKMCFFVRFNFTNCEKDKSFVHKSDTFPFLFTTLFAFFARFFMVSLLDIISRFYPLFRVPTTTATILNNHH